MTKPLIFTISAAWNGGAAVWTGHCDDIPAAADAPTLDGLLAKYRRWRSISSRAIIRESVYLQITALREAEPAAAAVH